MMGFGSKEKSPDFKSPDFKSPEVGSSVTIVKHVSLTLLSKGPIHPTHLQNYGFYSAKRQFYLPGAQA